jgi:hypothetical protein
VISTALFILVIAKALSVFVQVICGQETSVGVCDTDVVPSEISPNSIVRADVVEKCCNLQIKFSTVTIFRTMTMISLF